MTASALPVGLTVVAVLVTLVLTLVALRRLQVVRRLAPEVTREILHASMSAVALTFPWLFDADWPVLLLAVLGVGTMLAIRTVPTVRDALGGVLHVSDQPSVGDLCFPVAVCGLYLFVGDSPVLYTIPLLLLGVAGPLAALVGVRMGQTAYSTVEGPKSREGTAAFAVLAFLCVHVPLVLFTPAGRVEGLWIAAIAAALATIVEAVSWRGLDNLFLPLGTVAILMRLLTFPAPLLAGHAVVMLLLILLASSMRRETTVGGAGVFGAVLIGYLVWALGGTAWLLPPVLVYLLYTRVWPAAREADGLPHDPRRRPHTAHNVFSVSSVGVLWLLVSSALDLELLVPYALAWAVTFSFLGVDRMRVARPEWSVGQLAWRAAWRATLVGVGPVLLVVWLRVWAVRVAGEAEGGAPVPDQPVLLTLTIVVLSLLVTAASASILARWKQRIDLDTTDFEGRVFRAGIVGPLSALGLLALLVP